MTKIIVKTISFILLAIVVFILFMYVNPNFDISSFVIGIAFMSTINSIFINYHNELNKLKLEKIKKVELSSSTDKFDELADDELNTFYEFMIELINKIQNELESRNNKIDKNDLKFENVVSLNKKLKK